MAILPKTPTYRTPNGPGKHPGCWQLGTASRYRRSAAGVLSLLELSGIVPFRSAKSGATQVPFRSAKVALLFAERKATFRLTPFFFSQFARDSR